MYIHDAMQMSLMQKLLLRQDRHLIWLFFYFEKMRN